MAGGGADGGAYYNQVYGNMQSLYSQMPSYDQTPTPVALPVADVARRPLLALPPPAARRLTTLPGTS